MPCNLALSIAKATVADEHLWSLLEPRLLPLVSGFLQQAYPQYMVQTSQMGAIYLVTLGPLTFAIERGEVRIQLSGYSSTEEQQLAETISSQLSLLLDEAASRLFQDEIGLALGQLGTVARKDQAIRDEDGEIRQAAVFTVELPQRF